MVKCMEMPMFLYALCYIEGLHFVYFHFWRITKKILCCHHRQHFVCLQILKSCEYYLRVQLIHKTNVFSFIETANALPQWLYYFALRKK